MLVAIAKNTNIKKVANYTTKEDGPFICPSCKQEVIFKRGTDIANSFAHKVATDCAYGAKEKEVHRRAKMEVYDGLMSKGYSVELECEIIGASGKTYLVDLIVDLPQGKMAIELNKYSLSPAAIRQQICDFHALNLTIFWGCFIKGSDLKARYLPDPIEKLTHTLSGGTVYYWVGGINFKACHYTPYTPRNKMLERTYQKYVTRQFDGEKRPIDETLFLSVEDKKMGSISYPFLLGNDWYDRKDNVL